MKWSTFYSCERLSAWCLKNSATADAVSFDLFDTVLVRRVHDPDLVKRPVAQFLAARLPAAGRPWTPEQILRFRNRVEAVHRRRAGAAGPDQEACYPAFMADLLARLFPSATDDERSRLLREATDYELDMESRLLVPRAALRRLMEALHARGKRILLISDMYLPAGHLQRLAASAGLAPLVDGVVSSADSGRAKASGAAWPLVRDRFRLDPERWLHVGDNPVSDGLRPAGFGIRAAVLRDPGERARKAIAGTYWRMAQSRPFWRGRLVQQWAQPLEAENAPRHPLYTAGSTFFAPLFAAFVQHVAEQCRRRAIRRVYFFSREGDLFLQIWNRMAPVLFAGGCAPAAHYLQVSRMALAGPSCAARGLDAENAAIAFLPATNRDFRDLARIYGLDADGLAPHLARHGLRPDTVLSRAHAGWSPHTALRFQRLLDDPAFQESIKRQTADAGSALHRYLESEHFFEQPDVAVVDIGWLGTIQRFLFQAAATRPDCPRLHGFVFALAGAFPFPVCDANRIEGFIFDRTRFELAGSLVMTVRDLFEEAARAPHPGLTGYRRTGAGFELEFRSAGDLYARNERAQSEAYAPLRAGILDAVGRLAAAAAVAGYRAQDLKPWLQALLAGRLAFPTAREVALLRHRHHMDEFASHPSRGRGPDGLGGPWRISPRRLLWMPGLRLWLLARHAVCMLRQ